MESNVVDQEWWDACLARRDKAVEEAHGEMEHNLARSMRDGMREAYERWLARRADSE